MCEIIEIINSLEGSTADLIRQVRVSERKYRTIEIVKSEVENGKIIKKSEHRFTGQNQVELIHTMGVPKGEVEKGVERFLEEKNG